MAAVGQVLPDMSRAALVKAIRAERSAHPIKLLALVSEAGQHPGTLSRSSDIDAYLPQPAPFEIVHDTVDGLLLSHWPTHNDEANAIDVQPMATVQPGGPTTPAVLHGRVLLVDDAEVNRRVAVSMLTRLGLDVFAVADGSQALEHLQTEAVDLVLMDCLMPVMDGFEATHRIRAMERDQGLAPVPILALTANISGPDRARCIEAGMNDLIAKPVSHQQLLDELDRWLGAGPDAAPHRPGHEPQTGVSTMSSINQSLLGDLRDAMGEDFDELISTYLDSTAELLTATVAALDAADAGEAQRLAHSLKSSSASVGAITLSQLARSVEMDAREGHVDAALHRMGGLHAEFDRAREELLELEQQFRASAPGGLPARASG